MDKKKNFVFFYNVIINQIKINSQVLAVLVT